MLLDSLSVRKLTSKVGTNILFFTGTTLYEAGYTRWGIQQPDGGDKERCGSMFYDGTLNDIACNQKCFFICERETQEDLNVRVGKPN